MNPSHKPKYLSTCVKARHNSSFITCVFECARVAHHSSSHHEHGSVRGEDAAHVEHHVQVARVRRAANY